MPSSISLPDGAKLAYDAFGTEHVSQTPIVLIGGLSSRRGDWETLSEAMAKVRPVILFDHRGMGESTYANTVDKDDEITIESMARDLIYLLDNLKWKEYIILGFSMGGVICQQIMLLLPTMQNKLTFKVTHFLLTGTLYRPMVRGESQMKLNTTRPEGKMTEAMKIEMARPFLESTFDPVWIGDKKNEKKLHWWLGRMTSGRPLRTIIAQAMALTSFDFATQFASPTFPRTPVLIIHGKLDLVVPYGLGAALVDIIPGAKMVSVGDKKGQIPNEDFGHHWYEYFDVGVWVDAIEVFLGEGQEKAKL